MELPFHLVTLQPLKGALDILRYFGTIDHETADADELCDALDLSDRSFSKAIRRLVTKGYVAMDGDMIYRLTEQGEDAVEELAEYDDATGGGLNVASTASPTRPSAPSTPSVQRVTRRMVLALPKTLVAEQTASVVVGFHAAAMSGRADVVVRVSVINGEPQRPADAVFSLSNGAAHEAIEIKPGAYDKIRLKLQAFQLGENPDEIDEAGGMYVDMPVSLQDNGDSGLVAYGTNITLQV